MRRSLLHYGATQGPVVVDAGQRAAHAVQEGFTGHPISVGTASAGQNPNNLGCPTPATYSHDEAMTATLHIEHEITDYPTWKAAFDRFADARTQAVSSPIASD